jgi:hypothetical protein
MDDAEINITWIEWNGEELSIETSGPEKTSEILRDLKISTGMYYD